MGVPPTALPRQRVKRDLNNQHAQRRNAHSSFFFPFPSKYIALDPIQGTVVPVYLLACLCFGLCSSPRTPKCWHRLFPYIIALLNSPPPPLPTPSQSSHHLRFFSRSASALAASLKSIAFCDGGVLLQPYFRQHDPNPSLEYRHQQQTISLPAACPACAPPAGSASPRGPPSTASTYLNVRDSF